MFGCTSAQCLFNHYKAARKGHVSKLSALFRERHVREATQRPTIILQELENSEENGGGQINHIKS